jgi:hypothetical protein
VFLLLFTRYSPALSNSSTQQSNNVRPNRWRSGRRSTLRGISIPITGGTLRMAKARDLISSMIVDFPTVKQRLNKLIVQLVAERIKSSVPLMKMVGVRRQHEGQVLDYNTMDGDRKTMEYLEHSFSVSFDHSEFETLTIADVAERLVNGALEMASSIERSALDTINSAADEVGNVVKSADITDPENLLRMLETVQVEFKGSRAHPEMPTLMAHPTTIAEFRRRFEAMTEEEVQDHLRRREAILDRKYAEYISREDNRKLVD